MVALVTSLLAVKTKEKSSTSEVQQALNNSFDVYTKHVNERMDDQDKKIKGLEELIDVKNERIGFLEGVVHHLTQHVLSLEGFLSRNGIPIPKRPIIIEEPPKTNIISIDKGTMDEL